MIATPPRLFQPTSSSAWGFGETREALPEMVYSVLQELDVWIGRVDYRLIMQNRAVQQGSSHGGEQPRES